MKRPFLLASLSFVTLLTASACSSAAGSAVDVDPATASAGIKAATALTTKYSADTVASELPEGANPISARKLIVTVPCAYAAENCKRGVDAFAEAARAVGWTTKMIDPAGNPDKARAAVQTAINLGADGIFFMAGSGEALGAALKDARAAGLVTVNVEGGTNVKGQFDTDIEPSATGMGRLLAAQITVQSKGKAKVLLVNDPEFKAVVDIHKGLVDGLKEFCPGCMITDDISFQIADLSGGLPTQVQSALAAHPDTDTVWAAYDAAASSIEPVIERSANGDSISMVSTDGLKSNLEAIRSGGVQTADVAAESQWLAYQSLDEMDRVFGGGEPELNIAAPYKLMTKDTITTVPWDGDVAWKSTYLTRWK
ncbi:sugar ABC transporter substrate-binding protein [Streptomyces sp. NPDC050535]|uniref:sugar ABC transporter substrate-binding protein n=1 Tax=Streptomyces sp. NPDC050535 TaxID=3365626 RepID=UPI0037A5AA14